MIKENVLRKNLLTNEIDTGSIDTIFEEVNKKALDKNGNVVKPELIIQEYPFVEASKKDIEAFDLENLRKQKESELKAFENTNECYTLTLIDNNGNSLTKHDKWLHTLISSYVVFFSDKGDIVNKEFTIAQVNTVKGEMNKKTFSIKLKFNELLENIKVASKEVLNQTDYIKILQDMDRILNVDELK
jgi:hypothetical protein